MFTFYCMSIATLWLHLASLAAGFSPVCINIPPGIWKSSCQRIQGKSSSSPYLFMSMDDDAATPPIVALNVILRIKPEAREKFLEVILNNQKGTLNKELEPLALEYIFGEDANEPNTFHFHEKYLGEAGVAAHNAAPHFAIWEDFVQTDPFTAPPEVFKFTLFHG